MTELLSIWLSDGLHAMTPAQFVDELSWRNFRHNRPKVAPAQVPGFIGMFANGRAYEIRYQQECALGQTPTKSTPI